MLRDFHLGLFDLLAGIVVFQYLVIAVFLFRNGHGKNVLLALFFLLVAINLIDGELMIHGAYYSVPRLALLEDSLVLTYGPILYLYTLAIIEPTRRRSFKDLLHFIPAFVLLLITLVFYTTTSEENMRQVISAVVDQTLPVAGALASFTFIFAHFFSYLLLSIRTIRNMSVSWLGFTLKTLGICFFISWLATFFSIMQQRQLSEAGMTIVVVILLYYINKLVIGALKDPRLFSPVDINIKDNASVRQPLDQRESDDIKSKLDHAMLVLKHYSDPDLTLDKLSTHIGVPSRKLSQFLNDVSKQSFFDYVNGLRVDEAQRLLLEPTDPKPTVQQVMYAVGFSSKSSFNTLFKQKTGKTPTVFRKSGSGS